MALSELFRADLDQDGEEEILIFELTYAPQGTLRAGSVRVAKPDANGILQPVVSESLNVSLEDNPMTGLPNSKVI